MNYNKPKNETETHFMLKEISKYILFGWRYTMLATEVGNMHSFDICKEKRIKSGHLKDIIDAVGMKRCLKKIEPGKRIEYNKRIYYELAGIEAKASLSDFKNGFCAAPAFTYVIAPINTIPHDLIPDKIGLIEVDFDNFKIQKWKSSLNEMGGVNLTIRAKRRLDSRFENKEHYNNWINQMLYKIAYRSSVELLFSRNYLKFE